MNEWILGIVIWLLSVSYFWVNPGSSFGKQVIFCSWIIGPCRMMCAVLFRPSIPIFGMFSGMTILGALTAIVLAHMFGERVVDRLNPSALRIKYIAIGFLSSVLFSTFIPMI